MPTQPRGEIAALHPEIGDLGQATLPEVGRHGAHRPVIVEADRREAGALAAISASSPLSDAMAA